MNPVITARQGRKGAASRVAAKAPPCLKTTRYDKIAALHRGVEPAEDDLAAVIIVRCLRTRRLTLVGGVPAAASKGGMATVRKASSGDAAGRCPSVE